MVGVHSCQLTTGDGGCNDAGQILPRSAGAEIVKRAGKVLVSPQLPGDDAVEVDGGLAGQERHDAKTEPAELVGNPIGPAPAGLELLGGLDPLHLPFNGCPEKRSLVGVVGVERHLGDTSSRRDGLDGRGLDPAVPDPTLRISGETKDFTKPSDSGQTIRNTFCPTCGTTLCTHPSGLPGLALIRAGTLDDVSGVDPQVNMYVACAPAWDKPAEAIMGFPGMAPAQR